MISANSKKRDSARMLVRRYVMDLIYQHGGEAVLLPSNKDLAAELGIARSTAQLELKLEGGFCNDTSRSRDLYGAALLRIGVSGTSDRDSGWRRENHL